MKPKILIVTSIYYEEIANNLYKGSSIKLKEKGFNYHQIRVPGVFEIPIIISKFIDDYDAFIALGCAIKGETPHFDYICNAVTNSIINMAINNKKPIGNGIITSLNKNQALERADPNKKNKGGEAATAVLSVLDLF